MLHEHFGQPTMPKVNLMVGHLDELNEEAVTAFKQLAEDIHQLLELYTQMARDGISENLYLIHAAEHPEAFRSSAEFRRALVIDSISLWPDASWAVVMRPRENIFAGRTLCYSKPRDESPFAYVIEQIDMP